ncbi:MAG: nitrite/sulfite reductase [Candidatus Ruminococcus intestinipullorum]|nr:nitrite/sulfite reductase [Candidatus Ruminococcus intestinipullorum]
MLEKDLIETFKKQLPEFREKLLAFEQGEIDRNTFKSCSGKFGSYAQKEGGYMLRLRLLAGCISKEALHFIVEKTKEYQIDLLKLTTCQTIQAHNLSAKTTLSLLEDALNFGIIPIGGGGDHPRNTMCSPLSGVEKEEYFDVLPYAKTVGNYLVSRIPDLHLPRKLKVGFSNSPKNTTHATFRDLGFVAREDGTFSVYCAGGLGPNPKLGVHILDGANPEDVTLYTSAMIRLFTAHGNYKSRAKARTRYLQDTLGIDGIREQFLHFLEEARKEESAWPIEHAPIVTKQGTKPLEDTLLHEKRIIPQKQQGLYSVSYHPIGGRLSPKKLEEFDAMLQEMEDVEIRLGPDGTMYFIHLNAQEVSKVIAATNDGASNLFESSISCIGTPICQHGIRNSYALLTSCIERIRKENFADGVLPKLHISGCPSSCGTHQAGCLGFAGHSKKVDGKVMPAFQLFVDGQSMEHAQLGTAKAILLESDIPEFLAALGQRISQDGSTFAQWYPTHKEEFDELVSVYA